MRLDEQMAHTREYAFSEGVIKGPGSNRKTSRDTENIEIVKLQSTLRKSTQKDDIGHGEHAVEPLFKYSLSFFTVLDH